MKSPPKKPRNVEKTRPISTFCQPLHNSACGPVVARLAPVSPAMSAWDSLVGKP